MAQSAQALPPFSPCVQCGRCSSGCPVAFESPHSPRRVIRLLQLGEMKEACQSPFLWRCAACQACSVRCPRGLEVAEIMLALRRQGLRRGWVHSGQDLSFYRAFGKMVEREGRVRELKLGLKTALRKFPLHPLEDALLVFKLWRRGRLR